MDVEVERIPAIVKKPRVVVSVLRKKKMVISDRRGGG